jgi:hypothetical protein
MPRYYFYMQDGDGSFVDEVGLDLPDMDAAIREARRGLADMVRDSLRETSRAALSIRIRDGADGPIVLSVTMSTVSPSDQDGH